jgi:hypothetical protein
VIFPVFASRVCCFESLGAVIVTNNPPVVKVSGVGLLALWKEKKEKPRS